MLLTTALYCLLLTLTWVCTHTGTYTHTHTQGSRLCSHWFTLDIAPDDWIKGDFFSSSFLLIWTLYNAYKFLLNSEKERKSLFI